jgi:hypothetical protein
MTLHWGQSHIAACLPEDLVARFNEAYADPNQSPDAVTGLPIYNGKTGELIMEMGADKPCRVSRRKMRNLFAEGIDVQMGKTLVGAEVIKGEEGEEKVELTFGDGSKATGSILVGCDGAKSRVRRVICGEETAKLTDVPVNMFNFPYKFDAQLSSKIRGMNELFQSAIHPDHGNMFWISSTLFIPLPPTRSPKPYRHLMRRNSPRHTPHNIPRPLNIHLPSPPLLPRHHHPRGHRPLHPIRPYVLLQVSLLHIRRALALRRRRHFPRYLPPPGPRYILGRMRTMAECARSHDACGRRSASDDAASRTGLE